MQFRKQKINSVLHKVKGDSRPYLVVDIYGLEFIGLLDSGATCTVMGLEGWERLQRLNLDLKVEKSISSVTVANGENCNVLGTVQLPIKLDNKVKIIKILVVLDINVSIIFGVDFWRYGCCLVFLQVLMKFVIMFVEFYECGFDGRTIRRVKWFNFGFLFETDCRVRLCKNCLSRY